MLLGPLPTPGVAYLTRAQRASLGVVISASHNPYYDNGIKFFSAQGTKLPDAWEEEVEQALRSEEHTSELQSPCNLVCRLLLEKKKQEGCDSIEGCSCVTICSVCAE